MKASMVCVSWRSLGCWASMQPRQRVNYTHSNATIRNALAGGAAALPALDSGSSCAGDTGRCCCSSGSGSITASSPARGHSRLFPGWGPPSLTPAAGSLLGSNSAAVPLLLTHPIRPSAAAFPSCPCCSCCLALPMQVPPRACSPAPTLS
jgi:hypothetical protein